MLGQSVVPVLLCTVTSVPSTGVGAAVGGPVAPRLARGLHVFLGRGESAPRGSGAFGDVMGARARQKMPPEVPISPETLPQGSGGTKVVFRASSDSHAVSAFGGSVLPGALRWGFSDRTWCRILPFVGYPSILIPDSYIYLD
jgi:hypothetical protein